MGTSHSLRLQFSPRFLRKVSEYLSSEWASSFKASAEAAACCLGGSGDRLNDPELSSLGGLGDQWIDGGQERCV
jgi:hypothetical protein